MPLFTSSREKRLWLYTLIVLFAILATLVFGRPLAEFFGEQNVQAGFFVAGMMLTGATILIYGIIKRPGKTESVLWVGLAAVYFMLFLRLGLPERSHLMEYSVLAIFIHMALTERIGHGRRVWKAAILAFIITAVIGILDETIQLLIPDRVFHTDDMLFNSFAAFMAITSSMLIQWIRKRRSKK